MTTARAAMLVCSGLLAPAAAQEPVVVAGSAFEVHCHGGDKRVAMQALATVEPVWAFPLRRPRCCFRNLTLLGINMLQLSRSQRASS